MAHEAKQYAQRNRQGSDWFSHDSNAVSAKPPCPAHTEPISPVTEAPGSEDTVDEPQAADSAADAAPVTADAAPTAAVSSRAQMIKPKSDSNEWFVLCCCYNFVANELTFQSDLPECLGCCLHNCEQ